jgi:hypothetical protein
MKKAGKVVLTIILVLVGIPLLTTLGLSIHYLVTRTEARPYMHRDYLVTIHTDSLAGMYADVLEAEAAEGILSGMDVPDLFLAINEFKSRPESRNPAVLFLLSFPADIQILDGGVPVIILNPGWRSIVSRQFPLLNAIYKRPGLDMNILQRDGRDYYQIVLSESSSVTLLFEKNLILLSTGPEPLQACLANREQGTGLAADPVAIDEMNSFRSRLREKGKLILFLKPDRLIDFVLGESNPLVNRIKQELALDRTAVAALSLEDERLSASGFLPVGFKTPLVDQFVANTPDSPETLTAVAPDDTILFTGLRFPSLTDVYALFLYFQNGQYDEMLEKAEKAAKLFFGLTFRDALGWAGTEAGVFFIKGHTDPVAVVKIGDRQKWDLFLEKLTSGVLLKQEEETLIGNVRINRIGLPPFLEGVASLFVKGISEPYYLVHNDTVLFSMDPETLAAVVQSGSKGRTLAKSKFFNEARKGVPAGGLLLLYFDLTESKPAFIMKNEILSGIMKYYQRGIFSLKVSSEYMAFDIVGIPVREIKATLFPGYPVPLEGGAAQGPVMIKTAGLPLLAWIDREGILRTGDIKGRTTDRASLNGGRFLEPPEEGTLAVFTDDGEIRVYRQDLTMRSPYPVQAAADSGFLPVFDGSRWYWSSRSAGTLTVFDTITGETRILPFVSDKPLLTPPVITPEGEIIIYPRDLIGTLHRLTSEGVPVDGWPVETGGPSKTGPFRTGQNENFCFGYLTQSGDFHLFEKDNRESSPWPVTLEGTFPSLPGISPEGLKGEPFAVVRSREGNITLLSLKKGNRLAEEVIPSLHGEEGWSFIADPDDNGKPEILFYGSGDFILMTDRSLTPIKGFPVKGYSKPILFDQNGDGQPELLTTGLDDNLYLYTIPAEALQ